MFADPRRPTRLGFPNGSTTLDTLGAIRASKMDRLSYHARASCGCTATPSLHARWVRQRFPRGRRGQKVTVGISTDSPRLRIHAVSDCITPTSAKASRRNSRGAVRKSRRSALAAVQSWSRTSWRSATRSRWMSRQSWRISPAWAPVAASTEASAGQRQLPQNVHLLVLLRSFRPA